jgi:hypothetical protein
MVLKVDISMSEEQWYVHANPHSVTSRKTNTDSQAHDQYEYRAVQLSSNVLHLYMELMPVSAGEFTILT